MTNREQLELAAKAAGYVLGRHTQKDWAFTYGGKEWNPLTDDGDALRLMVKLGVNGPFRINWGYGAVSTEIPAEKCVSLSCEDMEESDPLAATRRAIVRAAAEIGRNMK